MHAHFCRLHARPFSPLRLIFSLLLLTPFDAETPRRFLPVRVRRMPRHGKAIPPEFSAFLPFSPDMR